MPPKHLLRHFGTAQIVLSLALVAILTLLVITSAVREVEWAGSSRRPVLVQPWLPQVPPEPPLSLPIPSLSPAPSVSPAPSPTPSATRQGISPVRAVTAPAPSTRKPTTKPATGNGLAATLSVRASWEQGYVAEIHLVNNGSAPLAWTMTVTHAGQQNLTLTAAWGASGEQQATAIVLHGETLAVGASITFGYQVSKTGSGNAKPSGCSVVGGVCGLG